MESMGAGIAHWLAVLLNEASWVRSSSEEKFSGRGDFSLGVNMGSDLFPPKPISDESINQGLVCAYMPSTAWTTTKTHPACTIHEDGM